jgi:hypothetical protein
LTCIWTLESISKNPQESEQKKILLIIFIEIIWFYRSLWDRCIYHSQFCQKMVFDCLPLTFNFGTLKWDIFVRDPIVIFEVITENEWERFLLDLRALAKLYIFSCVLNYKQWNSTAFKGSDDEGLWVALQLFSFFTLLLSMSFVLAFYFTIARCEIRNIYFFLRDTCRLCSVL